MAQAAVNTMRVRAELHAAGIAAQLVDFHFSKPPDNLFSQDERLRLDYCLTPRPRNARACYPEHWSGNQFKPLGTVFLVPPGEAMLARGDECGRQSSLLLQLDTAALGKHVELPEHWHEHDLADALNIRDRHVQMLLLRLLDELQEPGFASEVLLESISMQLAVELLRYQSRTDDVLAQGGLSARRLALIDERLRELKASPSLTELADLVGLSVRQLTRGFKASHGHPLGEHVAQRRLEHARDLLSQDYSVKRVAYTLGFSSPSSFCNAFRRAEGLTPGEYQLRLQQGRCQVRGR